MKKFLSGEIDEIKSAKYALIDFFATWCGPCKMMAPEFEKVADEATKKGILIGKIDVDECEDFAIQNSIQFVPTVILFEKGIEVNRFVGPKTKEGILEFISKNI